MRPLSSAVQGGTESFLRHMMGLHGREGFPGRRNSKRKGWEVGMEFSVQGAEDTGLEGSRGRTACGTQRGEGAWGLLPHSASSVRTLRDAELSTALWVRSPHPQCQRRPGISTGHHSLWFPTGCGPGPGGCHHPPPSVPIHLPASQPPPDDPPAAGHEPQLSSDGQ